MIASELMDSDLSSSSNLTSSSASNASGSPASLDALYDCYLNVLTSGLSARFDGTLNQIYTNAPKLLSPSNKIVESLESSKGLLFLLIVIHLIYFNLVADQSRICVVCSDIAYGNHYGTLVCNGVSPSNSENL
jgi:hypothetical protein